MFLRKYGHELIGSLVVLAVILGAAAFAKLVSLDLALFGQNKDTIDAIGTIITTILFVLAAIGSYYRFFRGRTFSDVADLDLVVTTHDAREGFILHAISLKFSNKGAFPIWEPEASIKALLHGIEPKDHLDNVEMWQPLSSDETQQHVIVVHPQEDAQFYAFKRVPKTAWAVTYLARVSSAEGAVWKSARTVSNVVTDRD